jgi:GPH family glycoside/pentoside/hexuronide:cation symporter
MALVVGGICMVLGIIPGLFCKGIDSDKIDNREEISLSTLGTNLEAIWDGIVKTFKNASFVRLCAATFLIFNGFQLVSSFAYYIIVFHMFNGDFGAAGNWPAWFATASAVMTALFVIPVVTWMANKWGKRNAFIATTIISIIGYCLKWIGFDPENVWMIFLPIPFFCFGIGGLFTLMLSMTADVCDLDELENGMPRREGTFAAIYWLMVKFGQAIAMILGGAVLSAVGFDPSLSTQSAETMTNLRIADIVIPACTAAMAIWVMWSYDLSEKRAKEIQQALVNKRGEL